MKKCIILLFLIQTSIGYTQTIIEGKVVDSSRQPIAYATIKGVNNNIFFSDSEGQFKIVVTKKGENYTFSCVGYKNKDIILNSEQSDIMVILDRITFELNEVIVKNIENTTNVKTFGNNRFGIGNMLPNPRSQFALYISNENKQIGIIKSVSFFVKKPAGGNASGPFRMRIYSVNPITKKPQNDLLNANLIVRAKREWAWFEIDISKYNIEFPESGFFVAMEILPIDNYTAGELKKIGFYQNEYNFPSLGYVNTHKNNNSWAYLPGHKTFDENWSLVKKINYSIKIKVMYYD
jgi:hypothetical protein